jgi:hypothetical protein
VSINDLPESYTKRWVIQRKAKVVAGILSGLISLEKTYSITASPIFDNYPAKKNSRSMGLIFVGDQQQGLNS